jgi:BlaI family transcriptional regulator, penicillinase repressor
MSETPRPDVSDAEREILRVLWEGGPGTVRDVQDRLVDTKSGWQRSTVITLLQRLEAKGYVDSDKSSHAFVFRAVVSRDDLVHQRMRELADELCDGRAAPLLLSFAQRQKFSAAEIEELRRLVDDLASRSSRGKRK